LTIQDAQLKLLTHVRDRIHNGELTERGFARLIGISQPHAHNVLKGRRNLSPQIFDSILKRFNMSLLDLAPVEDLEANLKQRKAQEPVPEMGFLAARIGPGMPWPTRISIHQRFPVPFRVQLTPAGIVAVRWVQDLSMHTTLSRFDVAVLDLSAEARAEISPGGLYVIDRNGEAVFRYMRPGAHGCYLITDMAMDLPELWERVDIALPDLVRARVVWLGRERDRELTPGQAGRFLGEPIS
jgi:transcriptional regulator with XRE-family HTH domain